ncbi:hypothetical protein C8Q76DRAFT_727907 [Earliella scabrosa]|nr:hypothetical protein C8Q76DRAFT_727907 [Earliella scabrosa]
MWGAVAWHYAVVLLIAAHTSSAAFVNRTIDDNDGAVTYFPPPRWSQGASCSDCTIRPDSSRARDGTWHIATYDAPNGAFPFIEIQFTGTAIYVYNILSDRVAGEVTNTYLTFFWDGKHDSGSDFVWDSGDSRSFRYDQIVYYIEGLENGAHTLRIQPRDSRSSLIMFDYALVTTDEEVDQGAAPTPTHPIPITDTPTKTLPPATTPTRTSTSTDTTTSSSTVQRPASVSTGPTPPSSGSQSTISSHSSHSSYSQSQSSTDGSPDLSASSATSETSSATPTALVGATTSGNAPSAGVIAGAVVGGIVALVLAILGAILLRRRTRALPVVPVRDDNLLWASKSGPDDSYHKPNLPPEPSSASFLLISPGNRSRTTSLSQGRATGTEVSYGASSESHYATTPLSPSTYGMTPNRDFDQVYSTTSSPAPTGPEVSGGRGSLEKSSAGHEPSSVGSTTESPSEQPPTVVNVALQAQLAALQEEVARLREHFDAPPRYEQV